MLYVILLIKENDIYSCLSSYSRFSACNNFVHASVFYNVRITPATDHVIGTCAQECQCEHWQAALPCLAILSVEQQPILLCHSVWMFLTQREGCVGKDEEDKEMWKGERKANSPCCELHNSLAYRAPSVTIATRKAMEWLKMAIRILEYGQEDWKEERYWNCDWQTLKLQQGRLMESKDILLYGYTELWTCSHNLYVTCILL